MKRSDIKVKRFTDLDSSVCEWLCEIFPHTVHLVYGEDEPEEQSAKEDDIAWCEKNIGKSLYTLKAAKNGYYRIRSVKAEWDFWGCIFYFKNRNDAMRFKLIFGGTYKDYSNEQ